MFYRLKFDGLVGGILKHCGYDTSAALDFWPMGATPEWVKRGKSKKWSPVEAAVLAVSQVAIERVQARQMDYFDGFLIATTAKQLAQERGVRAEVLSHLEKVINEWMPGAAGQKP